MHSLDYFRVETDGQENYGLISCGNDETEQFRFHAMKLRRLGHDTEWDGVMKKGPLNANESAESEHAYRNYISEYKILYFIVLDFANSSRRCISSFSKSTAFPFTSSFN